MRNFTRDFELTPREREVLDLIWKGESFKEIAATLNISYKTAACHLRNIRGKLGARTSMQILPRAIEKGLFPIKIWNLVIRNTVVENREPWLLVVQELIENADDARAAEAQ